MHIYTYVHASIEIDARTYIGIFTYGNTQIYAYIWAQRGVGRGGGRDRICFVNKANRCYENPWWKQSYGYCRDREYQTVETLSLFSVKSGTIKKKNSYLLSAVWEWSLTGARWGWGWRLGYMYAYVHIYAYINVYMKIYIYIHIYTDICMYIYLSVLAKVSCSS